MASSAPSSFNSYTTPPPPVSCEQTDVIFSLTQRLLEHESEIRHLRQEKTELESQLILRGNPEHLDAAYDELLTHLKRREEEFLFDSVKREESHGDLERENRKLKDKVHASRQLLDEQEKNLSLIEKETDDALGEMRQQLHVATGENKEKNRQIVMLEDMVEDLTLEVEQFKNRENEDQSLLARLGERIESNRCDGQELEAENEELQNRVETQLHLLKEKEDEILEMESICNQREDKLIDDLEQMRLLHNDFVDSQRIVLEDREEEIRHLQQQCEKYEDTISVAECVTHEKRADLKAKKTEIENLSTAIKKGDGGILDQLDKMCSTNYSLALNREEEMRHLQRQCDKYENTISVDEYVTHEKRATEIENLSTAIKKGDGGLFDPLDKMCSTNYSLALL